MQAKLKKDISDFKPQPGVEQRTCYKWGRIVLVKTVSCLLLPHVPKYDFIQHVKIWDWTVLFSRLCSLILPLKKKSKPNQPQREQNQQNSLPTPAKSC